MSKSSIVCVVIGALAGCSGAGEVTTVTEQALSAPASPVTLVAQHSSKCVDLVSGKVWQESCSGASSQTWTFHPVNGGYQVVSSTGLCLSTTGNALKTLVAASTCSANGVAGEVWVARANGSNTQLQIVSNGLCMSVAGSSQANGASISQYSCISQSNEYWAFNAVATDAGADSAIDSASDAGADSSADTAADVAAETSTDGGCGLASQTGDFHLTTTDGAGKTRDYEVIVPSPYDPSTPLALTFVYHGAGSNEGAAKGWGLQNANGAAAASIFVFPQGVPYLSYGVGWNDLCGGYDMTFFDNMVAYLTAHYCIDAARIFTAGFSWGCDQVTALSCCRGNRIRAMAAASCTDEFSNSADYRTYANSPCPYARTTAVRFTHDPNGDYGYTAQQFASTSRLYQSQNACGTTSTTSGACTTYLGCARPTIECVYPGLGHALPATWASDTWAFFSSGP